MYKRYLGIHRGNQQLTTSLAFGSTQQRTQLYQHHTKQPMSDLSSLARSKLHLSISKDVSLHRWVLLKNSILHSPSVTDNTASYTQPELTSAYPIDDGEEEDDAEEVLSSVESDAFMFPDAGKLVGSSLTSESRSSEAQWLDSLLETLGDDDDDDDFRVDSESLHHHPHDLATLAVDDDEFPLYSPLVSPMSSSDDLPNQPAFYSSSISVPYPVPYPAYQPPLLHAYHFDSISPSSYEAPLPYHDLDDLDLPVPDAIEDTSDDESDVPTTPSLGHSSSSLSLVDSTSIPHLQERSRLRDSSPRVYVDSDDSYFYSFEVDPLPFPDEHLNTSYNGYQEC